MSGTLVHLWRDTVNAAPSASALIDAATGRHWSRVELDTAADHWTKIHGTHLVGQTIAFAEANGSEWLIVFLGILKSQAIAMPLDPGEPLPAQRATASNVGAHHWWSAGELHPLR